MIITPLPELLRDQEPRSPTPIECNDSQAKALITHNASQKAMWLTLGVEATTELSPFKPACAAGHWLTHPKLDMFIHGARPKCDLCGSAFQLGTSAWTCYRCTELLVQVPDYKRNHRTRPTTGFALCAHCAHGQLGDVDSSSEPVLAPLTWKHVPSNHRRQQP